MDRSDATTQVVERPGTAMLAVAKYIVHLFNRNRGVALLAYFGFVFLKVLSVSLWSMPTALAIMRLTPLPAILAGATLSALPMLTLALFVSTLYLWISGYWKGRWQIVIQRPSDAAALPASKLPAWRRIVRSVRQQVGSHQAVLSLLLVSGLAVMALAPVALLVWGISSAVLIGIVARVVDTLVGDSASLASHPGMGGLGSPAKSARGDEHPEDEVARQRIGMFLDRRVIATGGSILIVVLLTVGYSQAFESMWLPHEKLSGVKASHGDSPLTGYVVSDENGLVYVMESGNRQLHVYDASSVGTREVCVVNYAYPFSKSTYGVETFFQWVKGVQPIPLC